MGKLTTIALGALIAILTLCVTAMVTHSFATLMLGIIGVLALVSIIVAAILYVARAFPLQSLEGLELVKFHHQVMTLAAKGQLPTGQTASIIESAAKLQGPITAGNAEIADEEPTE